ncbi:E3 ubiquitin-protein ligase rnf6 [Dispira parvispora]|uniref:E3 ubiquitin-protein ligase rnf6 n=1 Tax=Dispira parvispora TaxID=1520584 RepID=A0A9W8ATF8_9FUNG|nr:E3 ubiquitin-protein ligase rnf6 [Dispira parvispora]
MLWLSPFGVPSQPSARRALPRCATEPWEWAVWFRIACLLLLLCSSVQCESYIRKRDDYKEEITSHPADGPHIFYYRRILAVPTLIRAQVTSYPRDEVINLERFPLYYADPTIVQEDHLMPMNISWVPHDSQNYTSVEVATPLDEALIVDAKTMAKNTTMDDFQLLPLMGIICVLPSSSSAISTPDPPPHYDCITVDTMQSQLDFYTSRNVQGVILYPWGQRARWTPTNLLFASSARKTFVETTLDLLVVPYWHGRLLSDLVSQTSPDPEQLAPANYSEHPRLKLDVQLDDIPLTSPLTPEDATSKIYKKVQESEKHNSKMTIVIIAVVLGVLFLLMLCGAYICYRCCFRRRMRQNGLVQQPSEESLTSSDGSTEQQRTSVSRENTTAFSETNTSLPLTNPFESPQNELSSSRSFSSFDEQAPSIFLPHLDPNLAPSHVIEQPLHPTGVARFNYYPNVSPPSSVISLSRVSLDGSDIPLHADNRSLRHVPITSPPADRPPTPPSRPLQFDPTQFPEFVVDKNTVSLLFGLTWGQLSPTSRSQRTSLNLAKLAMPLQQTSPQGTRQNMPRTLPLGSPPRRARSWYLRSSRFGDPSLVFVERQDRSPLPAVPATPIAAGSSSGTEWVSTPPLTSPSNTSDGHGSVATTIPPAGSLSDPNLSHSPITLGLQLLTDTHSAMDEKLDTTNPASLTNTLLDKSDEALKQTSEEDDEILCSICLDVFDLDQRVRQLPCRHVFHIDCIDPWLAAACMEPEEAAGTSRVRFKHPPVCPMCKADFSNL